MCAAIASVMVQQPFEHIQTGDEKGTTNTFYESWVNRIDIRQLLRTDDVARGGPLLSLLDSSVLDEIADYALAPGAATARPYIADDLTLFLTLTNVRGTPYRLYSDATSSDEHTSYFADRLRFEVTRGGTTQNATAKPLPSGQVGLGAWQLLKKAAMATGAVPVALASRIIERDVADYKIPGWEPLSKDAPPLPPAFPANLGNTVETLNVDGGVTDDNPFQLAHDYLALELNQASNPREPEKANAAVITVAPFPMEDTFKPGYKASDHQGIWSIISSFFSVCLSQSRFLGESLQMLMEGRTFSRFVIAPSDDSIGAGQSAIQCASLGAFGGFFCRDFRKHDFLLGRRNCQQFLRTRFAVLATNPIVAHGLSAADPYAAEIENLFLVNCPTHNPELPQGKVWMPLIPLCGSAKAEVRLPVRGQLKPDELDEIVDLIVVRLNAIRSGLASGLLGTVLNDALCFLLNTWIIRGRVKKAIREALQKALAGDAAAQQ
jgi:hypothetical protein